MLVAPSRLLRLLPKPVLFATFAALGCLIGALLGQPVLEATKPLPPPPPPSHAVSLLIDTSGSMKEPVGSPKIDEVKLAATKFVQRRHDSNLANQSRDSIALVAFDTSPSVVAPLTSDLEGLVSKIETLTATGGSTKIDLGLTAAAAQLENAMADDRSVLLFTDGQPDDKRLTEEAAASVRGQGNIRVLAIATQDADLELLSNVTGDQSLVFQTSAGNFEQSFRQAEKVIYRPDIVTDEPVPVALGNAGSAQLIRTGGIGIWTGLLAVGASLALIISQNIYMKRSPLTLRQGIIGVIGGLLVGLVSGVIGQALLLIPNVGIGELDRIVAWTVLGALLGLGMSLFVPNLKPLKALLGGFAGGLLGVLGFLLAASVFGDVAGRLVGAAILGFFIGLMIALVERIRDAWLVVYWSPKEQSTIGLGTQPVILGSSEKAHIYLPKQQGYPPTTATVSLKGGKIEFEDKLTGRQQSLRNGSKLQIGTLTIEVKTAK